MILSLLVNTSSSLLATGDGSLLEPSDALRYASAFTALLDHVPDPESPEELQEILDLKVESKCDSDSAVAIRVFWCASRKNFNRGRSGTMNK